MNRFVQTLHSSSASRKNPSGAAHDIGTESVVGQGWRSDSIALLNKAVQVRTRIAHSLFKAEVLQRLNDG